MRKLILLADNDPKYREPCGRDISEAGFTVIHAADPKEAHEALLSKRVDLGIIDQRLEDDKDSTDISGWKIARDPAYKHVPKILLSGYSLNESEIRRMMNTDDPELLSTVSVVNKKEGVNVLLSEIEMALKIWPSKRVSMTKVSEQVKKDYEQAQLQAKLNFNIAMIVSVLGFVIIFIGIFLAWSNRVTIGIVGSASGIVVEVLGYLFYRRLDLANKRMDTYHQEILQTYWLEMLLASSEQLPEQKQYGVIERAMNAAINRWIWPITYEVKREEKPDKEDKD